MRRRSSAVTATILLAGLGLSWGALSASAATLDDPTPTPAATSSGQVAFTVPDTSSPTPTPGTGTGGSGGSHAGGSGGSGGSGSGGTGGTTPPTCVPTTTTPALAGGPTTGAGTLHLSAGRTAQGSDVTVTGEGFQAGEKVVIALYSAPVKLGVFTVRSTGQVFAQVTIPKRTQLGSHTIQVTGFQDCKVAAATIQIVSPRGPGTSIFPWIVWAVAGGGLGLAAIGVICAFAFGWIPSLLAIPVAVRPVP